MSSYCCRGFIQHLNAVVFVPLPTLAGGSQVCHCAYRRCPCQALPTTVGDGCMQIWQTHCCRPPPAGLSPDSLKVFNNKLDENTRICLSMYSTNEAENRKHRS